MNNETRQTVIDKLVADENAIIQSKGKAYAGTGDVLDNFKRNAESLGLTKYQVWAVYFGKHIDSIRNAIRQNPEHPIDGSEGMDSRIVDVRAYAGLLQCMLDEDNA